MSYFMKNAELFNTLIIINTVIQPGCAIREKSVKYARYLIMIIRIATFKTNL